MKNLIFFSIAAILFFAACNSTNTKQQNTQDTEFTAGPAKDTTKKDFSNVQFASLKDTTCGMPLSAGVEDTAHVNGKVYGFCSAACKNAFVARLNK